MDRLIHTTLSGLRATMEAQRVTANNVANAATIGFRRDDADFASRFLGGSPLSSRADATDSIEAVSSQAGALIATGNPLDIALSGDGWLAIRAGDGTTAYTRRGDLRPGPDGTLQTGDGHVALGEGGSPIKLPAGAAHPEISADGSVSFQPPGGGATARALAGRLQFATPAPGVLRRGGDGLLYPGIALPADMSVRIVSGHLEQSNVNPVAEMVDLMERARSYELQVRMISGARDLDQSSAALMRVER